jgi:hypothetical protein
MGSQQDSLLARRAPRGRVAGGAGLVYATAVTAVALAATVAAQPPSLEPRVVVGKCISPQGTLLEREQTDSSWTPLGPKEKVHSRDLLLALPGVRAAVDTTDGSIRLGLWGSLPEWSPFPVLESAVILHDSRAYDLDFTLDRGRVVLTNRKKKGEARVWVRLPETAWDLTLLLTVVLHVLKGNATLKTGRREHSLSAPPGPALFVWDNVSGPAAAPEVRKRNPDWANPEVQKKRPAALLKEIARLSDFAGSESVEAALAKRLRSADKGSDAASDARRRLAVYSMAAIDDLQGLTDALVDTHSAVTRQAAIEALRHWMGRGPGQDQALYRFLVQQQKYPEAQAETIMQLLHSPFEPDRPETYDTLIAYLQHSRLAVRELARWHLYRLAPAGRKIVYDAAASAAERQKGYAAWKKLIPDGKLPPPAKPSK